MYNSKMSLLEKFPDIAREAYGWDPSRVSAHNRASLMWKCEQCSRLYPARVCNRTGKTKTGCPECGTRNGIIKKQLSKNITSFASEFPEKATEAYLWDPYLYAANSRRTKKWRCSKCGMIFDSTVKMRSGADVKARCPHPDIILSKKKTSRKYAYYINQKFVVCNIEDSILIKFPDLVLQSDLSKEFASKISPGAGIFVNWTCPKCKFQWFAMVNNRALKNQGCAQCSKTGYNASKSGVLYLLKGNREHTRLIQYGITNNIKKRISYHKRNGFYHSPNSEFLYFDDGREAVRVEQQIKKSLKLSGVLSVKEDTLNSDKFPGYSETFSEKYLLVDSLSSLIKTLGISLLDYDYEWIQEPPSKVME